MSTHWLLRKRKPSESMSGANVRIRQGEFGQGFVTFAHTDESGVPSIYSFHEGDVFLPGAGNQVFEPNFELPVITLWGRASLRPANVFNPLQPPQVYSNPNVQANGLGGLIAGQLAMQPLSSGEQGGA